MVWARIDDQILDNPKIARAGVYGFALHVAAITWCCRNLSDGQIPYARVTALLTCDRIHFDTSNPMALPDGPSSMVGDEGLDPHTIAAHLIECGLWRRTDGGYEIHDFLEYNPSREQVDRKRGGASERQAKKRANTLSRRDSRSDFASSHAVTHGPVTRHPDPDPDPLKEERESAYAQASRRDSRRDIGSPSTGDETPERLSYGLPRVGTAEPDPEQVSEVRLTVTSSESNGHMPIHGSWPSEPVERKNPPRKLTNSNDDGANGMTVTVWSDAIRLVTGVPCPVVGPSNVTALVTIIRAHCPTGEEPVEWTRSAAKEFATARRGKTLSPFAFGDWLASGKPGVASGSGPTKTIPGSNGAAELDDTGEATRRPDPNRPDSTDLKLDPAIAKAMKAQDDARLAFLASERARKTAEAFAAETAVHEPKP